MSTPAAPPAWMLGLVGLDAGAKLALIGARSFGPFDGEARGVFVFPSRAALAHRIGVTENTLKSQLKRLVKLGHMTAETRRVDGAILRGWVIQDPPAGSHVTHGSQQTRVPQDPAMGHSSPAPGSHVTQTRVSGDPLNLQTFQLPSNDLAEDASARPPTPSPEEHPHGDTRSPRHPTELISGTGSQHDAGPNPAPELHSAGGLGGPRVGVPEHVQRSLTRATGDDTRGAREHRGRGDSEGRRTGAVGKPAQALRPAGRLTPELTKAVAAAGDVWGAQLGHQRFEQLVLECVDDLGLTPEELTQGLLGWETADRRSRPPRSQWLYGRNRPAFKLVAGLGDGKPSRFSTAAGEAEVVPLDWGREVSA